MGNVSVYEFYASDNEDDRLNIEVEMSWQQFGEVEAVPDTMGNYTFTVDLTTWSSDDFFAAEVSSLVFFAMDSAGVYGELNPRVEVEGCRNGGNDTTLGERVTQGTTEFLNCECPEG